MRFQILLPLALTAAALLSHIGCSDGPKQTTPAIGREADQPPSLDGQARPQHDLDEAIRVLGNRELRDANDPRVLAAISVCSRSGDAAAIPALVEADEIDQRERRETFL